jgi:predicted XRE-type DNA-binding protein
MTKRKLGIHEGSGNLFADLGLPNSEERMLKADIVAEFSRLIKGRGLTQVKAAKLVGISQPDLSHLLRGDFDDYSAERLMKLVGWIGAEGAIRRCDEYNSGSMIRPTGRNVHWLRSSPCSTNAVTSPN